MDAISLEKFTAGIKQLQEQSQIEFEENELEFQKDKDNNKLMLK